MRISILCIVAILVAASFGEVNAGSSASASCSGSTIASCSGSLAAKAASCSGSASVASSSKVFATPVRGLFSKIRERRAARISEANSCCD